MPLSKYVTPEEIRQYFNEGGYFERTATGELRVEVTDVGPSRAIAGMRSQMVRYRDQRGRTVAILHQYGDEYGNPADGTRPDPKTYYTKACATGRSP